MGQQHHILQPQQRLRHMRLPGEDVEPGGVERARLERGDQGRLVDNAAAGDVDDDALRPERGQHGGIDQPPGLRPARGHDHQGVDGLGHPDQAVVIGVRNLRLLPAPVIGDRHPEALQPLGDGEPDPPEPEDADPALPQGRGQRIGFFGPAPGPQVAVGLGDLAHGGEQQPEGEVGHLVGEHVRRVGDDHPAPGGLGHVDGLVADPEAGHDLEPRQPVEQGGVDRRMRRHRHPADVRPDLPQEGVPVRRRVQGVQPEARGERLHHARLQRLQEQDLGCLSALAHGNRAPSRPRNPPALAPRPGRGNRAVALI